MSERFNKLTQSLVGFPRLVRILIVAFFAFMIVTALFPLVDSIYLDYFFSPDTTILPALFTVTMGSVVYIWGWYIYIGTVGTTPPAKRIILWYFVLGLIATILVIGLVAYGIFDLNIAVETA